MSYLANFIIIMSWLKFAFAFSVLAVSIRNTVSADDRDKIKAAVFPHVVECSAEFEVTEEELRTAEKSGSLGTIDACFMGCLLKRAKLIDDQGLFDVDKAKDMIKKYFSDEASQKKALDVVSTCKAVNERDVTDGEKGCERAGLLIDCFMPFKDTFVN